MYVDLSVPINEQTPIYPGDPEVKISPAGVLANDGYCDHYISMGTHVGTHIDAPMHMLEGGKSVDQIPLGQFIGSGRVVEVTAGNFEAVKEAGVQAGDVVLFCTGMSDKYHDKDYFEDYAAMSEEVARYLVEAKVKMVGVDTCSVDNQEGFPIHKILLGGDVLIIENLTNLRQLADKECTIYALPIKLQTDGSPARVIAEIKQSHR
jgi:arylformamidase